MRQLFVILRQQRVIQRLMRFSCTSMAAGIRGLISGLSAGQQRPNSGRTCCGSSSSSVTASMLLRNPPIDAPVRGLGGGQRVLRQQRRIDNADQQLFRQPQLRLRTDLQVAIKVGAEDPKLRRWATCCWPPVSGPDVHAAPGQYG